MDRTVSLEKSLDILDANQFTKLQIQQGKQKKILQVLWKVIWKIWKLFLSPPLEETINVTLDKINHQNTNT